MIGVIGGIYAVFGGLKAVAVSDTLNGVGLLIVGAMVPLFGLAALGDGDVAVDVGDARQLVRVGILAQCARLVQRAPGTALDALDHVDNARAAELLAVAIGPSRE